MRNCLNCENACRDSGSPEMFCLAFGVYIFIPLDAEECEGWTEKKEE